MIPRPNFYKILSPVIRVTDTLIDVGCEHIYNLVDFETSPFKKLIGLDEHYIDAERDYRQAKTWGRTDPTKSDLNPFELGLYVEERFDKVHSDLLDYDFSQKSFSLLFCHRVLHFFPFAQQLQIIGMFYSSLEHDGLMDLIINHHQKDEFLDKTKSQPYKDGGFRGLTKTGEPNSIVHYPVDPEIIMGQLSKYHILDQYTIVEPPTFRVVIRKTS